MGSRMVMDSHNVLALSMAHTFPSSHYKNALLIISIKRDITQLCRELLTMEVSSLTFALDGLVGFMMLGCLPTPACTSGVRTKLCFQIRLSSLLVGILN